MRKVYQRELAPQSRKLTAEDDEVPTMHGAPVTQVVEQSVAQGTHYCDITGERCS